MIYKLSNHQDGEEESSPSIKYNDDELRNWPPHKDGQIFCIFLKKYLDMSFFCCIFVSGNKTKDMKTTVKYVIWIKKEPDWIYDELKSKPGMYIWNYRANYEYAQGCFKKSDAKKYCSFKAADEAGKKLVEIYDHFKGYEIQEIKIKK